VLRSPVDRVFAIVGAKIQRIREALAGHRIDYVVNPDAEGDMLSSVRCGLLALPRDCTAAIVVLGDQPGIAADLIAKLVRTFQISGRGFVATSFGGKRGQPLLFAMRYRREILDGFQEIGLRGLLHAHPEDVFEVEFPLSNMGEDIDLLEDYRRIVGERSN
jgi:molybdenum cofactor cytidylyltransferase